MFLTDLAYRTIVKNKNKGNLRLHHCQVAIVPHSGRTMGPAEFALWLIRDSQKIGDSSSNAENVT